MINKILNVCLILGLCISPAISIANFANNPTTTATSTQNSTLKNNSGAARRALFAFLHVTALVIGAPLALTGTVRTPLHLIKGIASQNLSETFYTGCETAVGYALTIYGYKGLCKDINDLKNDVS